MPLARTFDGNRIVTTAKDGYLDRLSKWSDIQEYLPFLHETARSYKNVRVLELGSRKGNSTLAFLAAAEETDGHVWSGDITDVTRNPAGMLPWSRHPRWTFICGDDMSEEVRARYPREVDIFFLDTSHEYDHTIAELDAYMPHVVKGGIALFHDTRLLGWPGYQPPTELPPVRQALDDWCKKTGMTWDEIPGSYGLGRIHV